MIILAGTFRLDPAKSSEAKAPIRAIVEGSRAEEGCIAFHFAFDALDQSLVNVFEIWRDQNVLDAHRATPHFLAWKAAQPGIGMHDRKLALYDVAGEQPTP
jgi:quinol monooxygenase YgiN